MRASRTDPVGGGADGPEELLTALKRAGSKKTRDEMGPRYGVVVDRAFGVPFGMIKAIAKPIGRDHALAQALWKTGWYEARMLACLVDDPALVTGAQMDAWRKDFDNWGIVDTVCFHLFDQTAHAPAKAVKWCALKDEFGKRAGFALIACLGLHRKDMTDAQFLAFLPLIEAGAADDRNFVKKGVSWALKGVGQRKSPALKTACLKLARALAASENATERFVGKDALKVLARSRA